LPSAVLAEVARQPVGLLEQIIEDRLIVRAILAYRANPNADGDLIDLVKRVQFDLVQEEIDADHAK
jgi:hypothetical protein